MSTQIYSHLCCLEEQLLPGLCPSSYCLFLPIKISNLLKSCLFFTVSLFSVSYFCLRDSNGKMLSLRSHRASLGVIAKDINFAFVDLWMNLDLAYHVLPGFENTPTPSLRCLYPYASVKCWCSSEFWVGDPSHPTFILGIIIYSWVLKTIFWLGT